MKIRFTVVLRFAVIAAATIFTMASCSKSNSNPGATVITATINGHSWTGQNFNLDAEYISAASFFSINDSLTTDSSYFNLEFPDSLVLNKPYDAVNTPGVDIVYGIDSKFEYYDSYYYPGHGTLTVTSLDKTNKKIAGTFSGTFYTGSITASDSVIITKGNFNVTYKQY